ncbi:MAG TPA: hypothetical protein VGM98_02605 [Schlesneria sp.]|jgi:hypothetical protein
MRSLALICLLLNAASLQAQINVQQPVVRTTSVGTTVSVPDRGRVFLGGVNSAESFRQNYGPFPSGTTRGYGLSGGSISASVYIIDLQAMDEAILSSVPDSPLRPEMGVRRGPSEQEVAPREAMSAIDKAANFERLARQAEAAGKAGVAKLHWQMAAKYGSTAARDQLGIKPVNVAKASASK